MKKISCSIAQTWITAYVDGSLDAKSRYSLEHHLLYCPQCRSVHVATAGLLSRLKEDVPSEPGETFWRQYDSSLNALLREKEIDRDRSELSWNVVPPALAAFALILAFGLGLVSRLSVPTRSLDTLSPQVVEELDRLYGPSLEEEISLRGGGLTIAAANCDPLGDDAIVPWFEVEEDAYHFPQWDQTSGPTDRQSSRRLDGRVASLDKIGSALRQDVPHRPECKQRLDASLPRS